MLIPFFFAQKVRLKDLKFEFCQFKGWVYCFSMQVVMNKCFLLNPEKNFDADPSYRF